jgi:DNA replication and repair protein RecF
MLAIAKPHRSRLDRECINWDIIEGPKFAEIDGNIKKADRDIGVKVLIYSDSVSKVENKSNERYKPNQNYKKTLTVNGVNHQLSQFIGKVNVVLFDAEDMKLVYGAPSTRRKFIDICVSQTDSNYFKLLQAYNNILANRNKLLKSLRHGNAQQAEIVFWDNQLVEHGSYLIQKRHEVINLMNVLINRIFKSILKNQEQISIKYSPNNKVQSYGSLDQIKSTFLQRLKEHYTQEVSQGFTIVGPHRDDIDIIMNENQAALFASRGQARSIALSFKLAQAEYIENTIKEQPIILLDDVLAELDKERKLFVMSKIIEYEQIILTTSDTAQVPEEFLRSISRLQVNNGLINFN